MIKTKFIDGDKCYIDPMHQWSNDLIRCTLLADEWFDKDSIKARWSGMEEDDFSVMQQTTSKWSFYSMIYSKGFYRITQCWYFKYEEMCSIVQQREQSIEYPREA